MIVQVALALAERLRVADHLPDLCHIRAGQTDEILRDVQLIHTVDVQRAEEHQVEHLADLAVVAVFDRQHGAVARAGRYGVVCAAEVLVRHVLGAGEDALGGDVRKRALHAAVCHAHSAAQPALIVPRKPEHSL